MGMGWTRPYKESWLRKRKGVSESQCSPVRYPHIRPMKPAQPGRYVWNHSGSPRKPRIQSWKVILWSMTWILSYLAELFQLYITSLLWKIYISNFLLIKRYLETIFTCMKKGKKSGNGIQLRSVVSLYRASVPEWCHQTSALDTTPTI